MVFGVCSLLAQTRTINGTVTGSEDGLPVPGASVSVKGTTIGTVTQFDGAYSLSVPENAQTLVISFVGMETQEIAIAGRSVIDVKIGSSSISMNEVLVVAYGSVRREAKTGSISSVTSEQISDVPVVSVDKMLAGKMAGVMVTSASGQPGASTDIRVRGTSSINAGNNPLYVVDGIPYESGNQSYFTNTGNALSSINPNDIESITVLKDAAAASVYGSRAANGVILITTKSGKEGASKFTARAKYGTSRLANDNNFGVMNAEELLSYQRAAAINGGYDPDDATSTYYRPLSILNSTMTDWVDHLSKLGKTEEYEITAQGGSDKTKVYSSLSYNNTEGVYYGIDYSKIVVRLNVDHQLTNKLDMGAKVNGSFTKSNDVAMQSLYYSNPAFAGMTIRPWTAAYDEYGNHNIEISENSNTNPRATAEYDDQWEKQYKFLGNFFLEWKPLKGLSIKTTNAADLTFGEGRRYWSPEANDGESTLQTSNLHYRTLTTSNTVTYNTTFDDHSLRFLGGQEATSRYYWLLYLSSPNVDSNIPYPNTSSSTDDEGDYDTNTRTLMSYFGIVDYNYASKYYIQASLRYDGSSLFASNKQWGAFYSAGASWNVHNEDFMKDISEINLLKLRLSYGVNGNNDIDSYQQYGLYSSSQTNGVSGLLPNSPANEDLSWELNKTWNVGVDFGLWNRFSGSIDVYKRKTEDMLLDKTVSNTTGFTTILANVGSLENKGLEFQIEGNILEYNGLKWDAGFNIAFNRSKILELADGESMSYVTPDDAIEARLKHIVGESLFTFYLKDYYGVNPLNGEALFRDAEGNLSNSYSDAAWVKAGSPEPDFTGGFNTSLSWKGLSLNAFLEFKGGNEIMIVENRYLSSDGEKMTMNQAKSALNYWKNVGDTGCNPKPVAGNSTSSNASNLDRWIEKGDYLRIKDITLAYKIPTSFVKKAGLGSARLFVSGLNIYTFHDVNFWDPERGVDGMGYGIYPMTKTFIGGIEIAF